MDLQWMAWTAPTALFFGAIALLIAAYSALGVAAPSVPRRGFLPMPTTRGDRLFVSLLGSAYINRSGVGLTEASQWVAVLLSVLFTLVIGRWG